MKSIPAPTQFELGLDSMSSILSKIALGTTDGNSFLINMEKNLNNILDAVDIPVMKMLMFSSKKYDALRELVIQTKLTNFQLQDIYESLNKTIKSTKPEVLLATPITQVVKNIPTNEIKNDLFLKVIAENTTKILKNLISGKSKESTKDDKEGKNPVKLSNVFTTIKDFAASLITIKENLTDKLIKKLNDFAETYLKFTQIEDSKNKNFTESITNFCDVIKKLDKEISKPTRTLLFLTAAMAGISFLAVSPMFALGVASIGGLIYVLSKLSANKEMSPNMDKFGLGILAIVGGMLLMQYVPWEAGAKMIVFIGALNLALRGFSGVSGVGGSSKTDSMKNNPFIMFGLGIGVLVLAMLAMQFVPWQAGVGMIAFITGLGIALNFSGSGSISNNMIQFATGIGILTLAMLVMNSVDLGSIFKMILFIGGLGLVMSMFNFDKTGPKNSMVGFAFGIGLMVLAILAIGEIDNMVLLKGILFIGALGLVMKLFNFDKMGPKNAMISFAFGFGIMVLAMYAINELPWEALGKTLLFLGGLGLVMKLFGPIQGLQFLALAGGIALISGALWLFKKTNLTLEDALMFGGVLVGLAGIVALMGIPAVAAFIGLGTIALIAMSIGLLIATGPLALISNINFSPENTFKFMLSVGILVAGFSLLAIPAVVAAVGATLFIAVAVASLLGALALYTISNMSFNTENTWNFMKSAGILVAGFALLALPAVPGAVGATLFLPIAGSAILGALALGYISKIKIDSNKIETFISGAKKLIEGLNDIGLWDLGKTSAKALLLSPIFKTAYLGGIVLQKISSLTLDNNKIISFGQTMSSFTSTIVNFLSENEKKLTDSKPGVEALAKILSITSGIARTIQLMANMEFYEYGVQNGKLVLKGVRKLIPADFLRVGQNLGTMLKCLIEPLVILGSDKSEFIIGGVKVTNPFKSGVAQKGIQMLADLGNAFQPLANSVKTYASIPMVSNPKLLSMFTRSLFVLTNTFSWVFTKISAFDNDLITNSINSIIKFNDAFKNADVQQITDLNNIFEKFVNNLSDQVKWKRIQTNLAIIKAQFGGIAKNINSIDIEKATAFERNVKNLISQNNGEQLKQAVIALTDLIGLVQNNQASETTNNPFASTSTPVTKGINNLLGTNINQQNKKETKSKDKNSDNDDIIVNLINSLQNAINLLSGKLDKTLNVKIVGGGNINSIG